MFSSKSKTIPAGTVPVTGFASGQWVANAKKLWGKGMDVYLAGETEGGKHEQTKYLLAEDYLPKGAVVHIDGREFRIDNVDFANDRVSLQDMTMLRQARFPIFRDEPIEFVRSYLEEEQPTIAQITAEMAEQLRAEEEQTLDRITDVEDSERAMTDPKVEADVFEALEATHTAFEDYSPEQMDVIYSAAEKGYDLEPLCNPAFSPEQMQLISDIEGRMEARTRASFREVFDFITKNELSILITEINMKNYKSVNVIKILTTLTLLRNSHLTFQFSPSIPAAFLALSRYSSLTAFGSMISISPAKVKTHAKKVLLGRTCTAAVNVLSSMISVRIFSPNLSITLRIISFLQRRETVSSLPEEYI